MGAVLLFTVIVVVTLIRRRRRAAAGGRADGPRSGDADAVARIVATAAGRLPDDRREWGRAMLAELSQINTPARRWRFAAGAVRLALFPPVRNPHRVLAAAAVGTLAAASATIVADRTVPSLAVFVALLGAALGGYATLMIARTPRSGLGRSRLTVAAIVLAGVLAAVTAVVRIAMAHPAATADRGNHIFSVLLAAILTGHVALAGRVLSRADQSVRVMGWGLTGGFAISVASVLVATAQGGAGGLDNAAVAPAGVLGTIVVAAGAAATLGSRTAGLRAGVITALIGALARFAIDLSALLQMHTYALTNSYDISAYPRSGYPDVASYLLSDAIAGNIIGKLVVYPLVLGAVALVASGAAIAIRQLMSSRTAHAA